MLYNYLKTALRNILRNKVFALINVLGLSIGLACFILLYLFLKEEAQFDSVHTKYDRMYRVIEKFNDPQTGEQHTTLVPGPIGEAMVNDFPSVKQSVSVVQLGQAVSTIDQTKTFNSRDYLFTTDNFFNLFDFELLIGDKSSV